MQIRAKNVLGVFAVASCLASSCLDRKNVSIDAAVILDGSSSIDQSGRTTDSATSPTDTPSDKPGPSFDGPVVTGSGGSGGNPVDVGAGGSNISGPDSGPGADAPPADLPLPSDVPQTSGDVVPADAAHDSAPGGSLDSTLDLPVDVGVLAGPEVGHDVGPDIVLVPDVPADLSFGPEAQPDTTPTVCTIDGKTYSAGDLNPSNACQTCKLSSPSAWSTLDDGTGCPGSGKYCNAGTCKSGCLVGGTFYATDAAKSGEPCQTCQPTSSDTSLTNVTNGTACGSGRVCSGGSCQTGCWFSSGSQFVASGTTNAANNCQICSPAVSTSGWSNNDGATVSCGNGSCMGTATCTNMQLGSCSKTLVAYYQDVDGDGYGNPSVSITACSDTSPTGYVRKCCDCNDSSSLYYPGVGTCSSDYNVLFTCQSSGTETTSSCANGCAGGQCRSFATVSVAGTVTCGALQCPANQGCSFSAPGFGGDQPQCGTDPSAASESCDGPNDCASTQVCCLYEPTGGTIRTQCDGAGDCPGSDIGGTRYLVCDPNQPACPTGTSCVMSTPFQTPTPFSIYVCR